MPEYIEKEELIKAVREYKGFFQDNLSTNHMILKMEAENIVKDQEAADVAPVVHGRWNTPKGLIECSMCGFGLFPDAYFFDFGECVHANEPDFRPRYCPHCGAKMDLEDWKNDYYRKNVCR